MCGGHGAPLDAADVLDEGGGRCDRESMRLASLCPVREVVRRAFVPLTASFEGSYITWLFQDIKGLVSTGFGLLLDPVGLALGLPWRRQDGSLASREDVVADWARVKNLPNGARLGHLGAKGVAQLRLDKDGLYAAFQGKMYQMEMTLRAGFPEWDEWPADAQLGTMSLAWAVGPAFYLPTAGRNHFPKLTAALRARDFRTAADECFLNEEKENPGIIPRNRANKVLFLNASIAQTLELDPDILYYPTDIASEPPGPDDVTLPGVVVTFPSAPPSPLGDDEPPDAA
jgi:hypothetical protein